MNITPFKFELNILSLYLFAIFFVIAGIAHFIIPEFYVKQIPFLPYPKIIVFLTGIMEIGLGVGMLIQDYRPIVVWMTILFLIAVFPANIYMAIKPELFDITQRSAYIRLPFQILFIIWVYTLKNI